MISRIRNLHLRRLALILATPVVMILAPFEAVVTKGPEIMADWYQAFRLAWRPR
jgi:hypothetical protein